MLRFPISVVLLLTLMVGCGGGGGSSSSAPSPFAGHWTGEGIDNQNYTGTANFNIDQTGKLTGTVHDNWNDANIGTSGTISAKGTASIVMAYDGDRATLSGTFVTQSNGHLIAIISNTTGYTLTFDLIKQ